MQTRRSTIQEKIGSPDNVLASLIMEAERRRDDDHAAGTENAAIPEAGEAPAVAQAVAQQKA
jgi:hypothetical protein